jgi:hypothetical protein
MERIIIDKILWTKSWELLGCICRFLDDEKKDVRAINRFGDYCARGLINNSGRTFNNFMNIKRAVEKDFGYIIVKENGTGFTLEDFISGKNKNTITSGNKRTVEVQGTGYAASKRSQRRD